jgi:hypothetical protein
MLKKPYIKDLRFEWVCTELGGEVFSRYYKLPEGEQVAHLHYLALQGDKVVDRPIPVSPSHRTFTRGELQAMADTKKDYLGAPLHGSFERAVKDGLAKFDALETAKAQTQAAAPAQLHLVEQRAVDGAAVETPALPRPVMAAFG